MDNVRCTIGYDAIEPRQMLVEMLVSELHPQDIVNGLLEGTMERRSGPGIQPGDIINSNGVPLARIIRDNQIQKDKTFREFSLTSEHCGNCGMPVEQASTDADKCIECTCQLSPVVTKKITVGWVTQTFHGNRCVDQEFTCGDEVTYENEDGDIVDSPEDEKYQPYFMILNHSDGP